MGKLTALHVSRATKRGLLGDGGGLYLKVTETGTKSWVFRFRENGRLRHHGLGSAETLSLAEAREKALLCRKMRLEGIDPIEAKKRRQATARLKAARSITFAECAEAYIEAHRAGWKNPKHALQWPSTLSTYVYPVFGPVSVADVDRTLVLQVLEPIWNDKTETATRLRGRIEKILDWARVRGYREGENPALWKGNLSLVLPAPGALKKVKHRPALPHTDMPDFWKKLDRVGGVAALALRFDILTVARPGETRGATWDEIDLDAALWTVPEERMKGGKEHRVPLSPQAVAVLTEAAKLRKDKLIFPGLKKTDTPLSDTSLTKVLRDLGEGDITVHGFRSTFRDWAADCTDVAREVAEACLAHTQENKAEQAYWRSDMIEKWRVLIEDWARFCTGKAPG
ncbi:tyrosine-type recombinase/integrase [Rhodospirillum sp. A1_3_36]|uniref:tyrosine-type recombinase/integrase n=1 Tax=Rhodospirillum sp. A1_3_36 TaxID=3391666 RepID=UPI0039A45C3D